LAYTSFDREWVHSKQQELSITELVEINWPHLSVQPLTPPKNLRFVIGWTGSPASTTQLVDKVREKRNSQLESYQSFLSTSKQCVEKMMNGFQQKNLSTIQSALRENRELLNQLSRYTGVLIETPALSDLCSIA